MKNFTRILAVVMLLAMALTLAACQGAEPTTAAPAGSTPVASTPVASQPTTTAAPTEPQIPEGYANYQVTVLNADGTPVVGAMVIICDEGTCSFPTATDENGVAVILRVEKEGWKAQATVDGVSTEYIYFEAGAKELVIQLG